MGLQDIFYILSIAFFVSVWILILAALAAVYWLTRRFRQVKDDWERNWLSRPLTVAAGSLPLMTAALPIAKYVWQWWQRQRRS